MISPVKDSLDDALLHAFLQTDYLVICQEARICVRIGQHHPVIDQRSGMQPWAILTAANPGAEQLSAGENRRRHVQLVESAKRVELQTWPSINRDRSGKWEDEHGLCLIAPATHWLLAQAQKFGQIGLVYGHPLREAELWLLVPCPAAKTANWVREVNP